MDKNLYVLVTLPYMYLYACVHVCVCVFVCVCVYVCVYVRVLANVYVCALIEWIQLQQLIL